jgi:hypothetical protein
LRGRGKVSLRHAIKRLAGSPAGSPRAICESASTPPADVPITMMSRLAIAAPFSFDAT